MKVYSDRPEYRGVKLAQHFVRKTQKTTGVRARAIWLAFEKFTRADLSQTALEIMSLAMLMKVYDFLPSSQSWPLNPDPSTHKH